MTGLAADLDALARMIDDAIDELRKKDPEHELLKFAEPVQNERRFTDDEWVEYVGLFAKEEGTTVMQSELNYLFALEVALGKREAPSEDVTT